jgi:hypothetical protein
MSYSAQQLSDLQCIRDACLRYCRGVDRLDADIMKSAYWADATDCHGVYDGNAWDFADFCMEAHLPWRGTMHCMLNHSITLEGEGRASGEIYNVTYLFKDGGEQDTWYGRYLDEYEKRDGEWRIMRRVCVHESTGNSTQPPMEIAAEQFRQGAEDRNVAAQA